MPRTRQTIAHLPVEQLTKNPANVREDLGDLSDLARSIHEQGVVEPLIVTEHPTYGFLLLDGHRRLSAGLQVGLRTFPAIIRHGLDDPAEQTILMLTTDVHKRAFKPMERANAYGFLRNRGMTGAQIASEVGVSLATVQAYLNLLHLDGETAEKVDTGDLPVTKAVELVVETRQAERKAASKPMRGRPPSYFGDTHPLARAATDRCRHGYGRLGGGVACGPCWEATIREDAIASDGAA